MLDAGHRVEWGWHVAAYLVTKGLAAGAALFAPFLGLLGVEGFAADWLPEIAALVFILLTTWLLIDDLARPQYFLRLITRPNTKSWLVRGGWILSAFGALVAASLGLRWLGDAALADGLRWVNAALALGVAGYTAFLFQQCEGRDLWQGKLVLPHLLAQAALCGAVLYLPFAPGQIALARIAVGALIVHLLCMRLEAGKRHFETENERQATGFLNTISWGPFARALRGAALVGCVLPALLIALTGLGLPAAAAVALLALAGLAACVGLYAYEHAFVRAGQLPPLS